MNARFLALAATLALAAAAPAQQHTAAAPPGAAAAGHWLYDGHGQIIGSVRSVNADGRTAVVALGVYFYDHVRVVEVPADALSVVDGKATLRAETIMALDARSRG